MNRKLSNSMQVVTAIPRRHILNVFKELNYIPDVYGKDVTILRSTRFPFYRVSLPTDELISVELLKKYAEDFGFSYQIFFEG